tara:strand:+ start:32198 stop:32455 length:258 start_codon:yes stop_codon:yes gene_type:complete
VLLGSYAQFRAFIVELDGVEDISEGWVRQLIVQREASTSNASTSTILGDKAELLGGEVEFSASGGCVVGRVSLHSRGVVGCGLGD